MRRHIKNKKQDNYEGDIFDPQRFRPDNSDGFEIEGAPTPYTQHPASVTDGSASGMTGVGAAGAGAGAAGMAGVGAGAASIPNSSTHPPSSTPSSGPAGAPGGLKARPLPSSQPSQVNVHTDAGRYVVNNSGDNPSNLSSDIPPTYDSISRKS